MIISDVGLIDTNILVYIVNKNSPFHKVSFALRENGLKGEISLCITPQILSEFFAVVTNPKRLEIPLTQEEAVKEIEGYLFTESISQIFYNSNTAKIMIDLLEQYHIQPQKIFDLQLVAIMLSNNITRIYTFNEKDFLQFSEIEVINPKSIIDKT